MDATYSPDRAAWRLAVAEVAAKAHEKLPACNGRIDSAVKIVLAGDVELLPAGGARVASRSDASVHYHTVNGHCDCKDYPRAPEGLCSHRLAYGIARRAAELVPQSTPVETEELVRDTAQPVCYSGAPGAHTPPLGEAPCSVNVHVSIGGRQVQVTLRGHDELEVLTRLEAVLARYPQPQPPAPASQGQSPTGEGWCHKHNTAMKQTTKEGRSWYSHRHEGQWCKGK
jgi:hypothetical protein